MTPKTRNVLILLLVLAVPVVIFIGSIFYNAFHVSPPPPFPNPNGYDDLINAAKMLDPKVGAYTTTNLVELQMIVETDTNALGLARAGLQKQCRVPLDYSPAGKANTARIMEMKYLGAGFNAEGDLARLQGRPDEAARSYLDMIHLANESSRGGVIMDQLVGIAIGRRGTDALQNLLPQLDAKTCRETAAVLETLNAQQELWDDAMSEEHYWTQRTHPGFKDQLSRIINFVAYRRIYRAAEGKFEQQQIRTRRLIIDLAAQAYELDKGKPPASIGDLTTNYLKTIPIDPGTGTNMTL